ncbi:MAG: DUF4956 domain-containing protein [Clostridia bacterium]|jgi:hypothetical protein|nr:DUF4956 domain-containing protein [Clostridia bacterium]MCI1999338.1 DUF4956 domain-containing protein [Clostridia bacterium]MCI2015160.1 DUF4956 domain-containing protein [Clostridia bacterium]
MNMIFSSILGDYFTLSSISLVLLTAFVLGLIVSGIYMLTHKRDGYMASLACTLVVLPMIIAIIIILVGNSVAKAFSLAGAFTIIRFRSTQTEPKDLTYVFCTLAIGLACGMGYVACAVFFGIIMCVVLAVLSAIKFGEIKSRCMLLKVTVPESLDYYNLFDDVFKEYTSRWKLIRIKTAEFGAVFRLEYIIELVNDKDSKKFMDDIRVRNGNLVVSLGEAGTEMRYYK